MPLKVKLKFAAGIPWSAEYKLVNEGNFRVHSRERNGYLILEKDVVKAKPHNFDVLVNGELEQSVQLHLRHRCNGVVAMFEDPVANLGAIEARLNNIANTLSPRQKQFVRIWMQNNLSPEDLV